MAAAVGLCFDSPCACACLRQLSKPFSASHDRDLEKYKAYDMTAPMSQPDATSFSTTHYAQLVFLEFFVCLKLFHWHLLNIIALTY